MILVRICRSTCDGDLYSVAGAAGVSVRAGGTALGSYACRFDNHMVWEFVVHGCSSCQPDFHVAKVTSGNLPTFWRELNAGAVQTRVATPRHTKQMSSNSWHVYWTMDRKIQSVSPNFNSVHNHNMLGVMAWTPWTSPPLPLSLSVYQYQYGGQYV